MMTTNKISHVHLMGIILALASVLIKGHIDGSTELLVFHPDTKFTPLMENLIDSRFKLLAIGLQDQIDELKGKVSIIETVKSFSNEETRSRNSNNKNYYQHGIQKREGSKELPSSSKASCQSASLFCTFYYPDHPDSNRNRKGKYSGTVNGLIKDPSKVNGIPSSCKDLQLLGHELNGLYSIKTSQPNNQQQAGKIETVFCDFQSSSVTLNNGVLETKIGVVDVKSSLIHFHVERSTDYGIDGQKIPFERQLLNIGNGFDWTNQHFKAPYSGIYFFSISGSKPGAPFKESRTSISVRINGGAIGEVLSSENTFWGGFAFQFSRKLNAGDKVELVMQWGKVYLLYYTGWLVDQDLAI